MLIINADDMYVTVLNEAAMMYQENMPKTQMYNKSILSNRFELNGSGNVFTYSIK